LTGARWGQMKMSLESARMVCCGADPKTKLFVNRIYPMNQPCIQEQTFRLIKFEQKKYPQPNFIWHNLFRTYHQTDNDQISNTFFIILKISPLLWYHLAYLNFYNFADTEICI
jgi:hypothetical protein